MIPAPAAAGSSFFPRLCGKTAAVSLVCADKENFAGATKNESGTEPCGSVPDPYMIRGKMMSYEK